MNAAIFVSAGAGLPTAFVWFWHRLVCSGVLARTLDEALLSHKRLLAWHDDIGQISGWRRGYSAEAMASDRRISAAMASVLSLEAGIDGRTCCEIVSHSISAIMAKRLQTYETPDITVTFDPNICQHSGVCLRLAAVFDVRRRDWVRPAAAPAEIVAAQIRRCPSGALQYRLPTDAASNQEPTRNDQ